MKTMAKIVVASLVSAGLNISAVAEVNQTMLKADGSTSNHSLDSKYLSYAFKDTQDLQVREMTGQEMDDTEGAVAPLVAVGVMAGARFIVTRWVTQKAAKKLAAKGADMLVPTRSIAKKIAGKKPIREYHPGPGDRYTHYHPNPRNGSHIWYGKPR